MTHHPNSIEWCEVIITNALRAECGPSVDIYTQKTIHEIIEDAKLRMGVRCALVFMFFYDIEIKFGQNFLTRSNISAVLAMTPVELAKAMYHEYDG